LKEIKTTYKDEFERKEKAQELRTTYNKFKQLTAVTFILLIGNGVLTFYGYTTTASLLVLILPCYTIKFSLDMQPDDNKIRLTYKTRLRTVVNPEYYMRVININAKHRALRKRFKDAPKGRLKIAS